MKAVFICFLMAISVAVTAQETNNLLIDFKVIDQNDSTIDFAKVELINERGLSVKTIVNANEKGTRYSLILDFDHNYSMLISAEGFHSKTLLIDTWQVPEEDQTWGYEYGGFIFDLLPISEHDEKATIGRIYYDDKIELFRLEKF